MAQIQGEKVKVSHVSLKDTEGKTVTREMSKQQFALIGSDPATNGGWEQAKVSTPKEATKEK